MQKLKHKPILSFALSKLFLSIFTNLPWQLCWLCPRCPACIQTPRLVFCPAAQPNTWWGPRAASLMALQARSPSTRCSLRPCWLYDITHHTHKKSRGEISAEVKNFSIIMCPYDGHVQSVSQREAYSYKCELQWYIWLKQNIWLVKTRSSFERRLKVMAFQTL